MAFSLRQIAFLRALMSARGTPYQWGGTNLQRGVDCSGLVYRAAQIAGLRGVPRTSQEQFAHGTPVQMGQLRPGDLVFSNFEGPGAGATHVVIYIGGGRVIAADHTGTNVRVEPLSTFSGHIVGARRYLAGAGQSLPNVSAFAQKQLAYHAQAAQGNQAAAMAALGNIHPIQVQQSAPLQTAQQALQTINAPRPQPLLGQAPSAFPQPLGPSTTDLSGQLDALHSRLLKL